MHSEKAHCFWGNIKGRAGTGAGQPGGDLQAVHGDDGALGPAGPRPL